MVERSSSDYDLARPISTAAPEHLTNGSLSRIDWPLWRKSYGRSWPQVAVQSAAQGAIPILFYVDYRASISRAPSCCDEILDCAQNDNMRDLSAINFPESSISVRSRDPVAPDAAASAHRSRAVSRCVYRVAEYATLQSPLGANRSTGC